MKASALLVLYLTVPPSTNACRELVATGRLGVITTPYVGRAIENVLTWPTWAADNGCYTNAATFRLDWYLGWLERMRPAAESCLFATAPDVVGDWAATWERSAPVLPKIRELGFRAAVVLQNGVEEAELDWSAFDAVFTGGDDAFKDGQAVIPVLREARARGKWLHCGRVNTGHRMRECQLRRYDSVDGTLLAFGPDENLGRLMRLVDAIERQPALPFEAP